MVDFLANRDYLMTTQANVTGGFSKWPSHHPGKLLCDVTRPCFVPSLSKALLDALPCKDHSGKKRLLV